MILIIGINFRQDVIQQEIIYLPTYYYYDIFLISRVNCIGIAYIKRRPTKCSYQQQH